MKQNPQQHQQRRNQILQQIAIRGIQIPQRNLLLLGHGPKPALHAPPLPITVRLPARQCIQDTGGRRNAAKANARAVTEAIVRLAGLVLLKDKRGDDAAQVAEANLPGAADSAAMMAPQVHVEPAHDDGHGGVDAHDSEKERHVLHVDVGIDSLEDSEASNGKKHSQDRKECPVSEPIRHKGHDHGKHKGHSPGRHAAQLRLRRTIAVAGNDTRRKVRVAVRRDDEAQIHDTPKKHFVVAQNAAYIAEGDAPLQARVSLIEPQFRGDVLPLVFAQPGGLFGKARQQEVKGEADEDGEGPFENEDPAPTAVAALAAHLANGGGEEAAECAGEGGAVEEEGVTALGFVATVPHADEVEGCVG